MTEPEITDFDFPEIGNNQQNIWRLRDELNATRRWIREHVVFEEEEEITDLAEGILREGVIVTRNGRYMRNGRLIPKTEAFV